MWLYEVQLYQNYKKCWMKVDKDYAEGNEVEANACKEETDALIARTFRMMNGRMGDLPNRNVILSTVNEPRVPYIESL